MAKKAMCFSIFFIFLISLGTIETVSASWTHLSSKYGDIPEPGLNAFQTSSLLFDVDLDGINDFIITRRDTSPNIVWYRRNTTGWSRYVIENNNSYIEAGGSFYDIDGDGDPDIVFGGDWRSNKVWWWENPYPVYDPDTPWTRREIKSSGANKHHDQIFGDFDGDGESELVFWNQDVNKLFLADIPPNPKTTQLWNYTEIWSSGTHAEGLGKGDIDHDGKIDLIAAGRWFKHTGGTNYTPYLIDDSQRNSRIAIGDLNEGGNPEIVMVPGDALGRLKWYECTGDPADPGCWIGHDLLGFDVDHGHSLAVVDMNNDGNLDIFAAEMRLDGGNPDAKRWIFYGNGNGIFQTKLISEGIGNHESKVGDLNGDGYLDILGKPFNWDTPRIDIWLKNNTNMSLDLWDRQLIDPEKPWRSVFITSADMDNDGYKDIITGGWWYKNPGVQGNTWVRHTIGTPLNNMATVYDFDGDGNLDVLGTKGMGSDTNANFVWGRNDGTGNFTILNNIEPGDGNFLQGVAVARFQNGGPLEAALSWHDETKGVQMLTVPANASTDMWTWRLISATSLGEALSTGDIDKDGDLDLLLGTRWLQNDGSTWNVFSIDADTTEFADRNILADINNDGRLDAIVGFEGESILKEVVWYEQSGPDSTWIKHIITTVIGPMSLDVADMDEDGDLDVVVGEHNLLDPNNARLYVMENIDSMGGAWNKRIIYTGDEHHDGTRLVDIDNDGDLDIISIGWTHGKVLLYENKAIQTTPIFSAGLPVSDDFNSQTLNTSLWTVVNPEGDATITIIGNGTLDSMLSIAVPQGQEHDVWVGNNAPRVMQSVSNTNFEIELKFQSRMTSGYQMQGVIIQQDSNNYLRFDFVRFPTGTNVFAASFAAGSPTTRYNVPIASGNPLYLRVNRTGDKWKEFYSYDGTNWILAADFNYSMVVSSAGPFAGNALGSSSPAFTGLIDYFFSTSSPVVPEDGGNVQYPFVSIQPGNQTVTAGQNATFSVVATGTSPLSYQWQKNGTNIPGATSASYTTQPTNMSDNGSTYRVKITNPVGSVMSDQAKLTIRPSLTLLSDDFSTPALNTSLWTVVNPEGDATITIIGNGTLDAMLSIAVPQGQEHDVWIGNNAPRVMQSVSNTNFEIELKFQSRLTSAYQMQGVIIQQDSNNYLRFDFVRFPASTNVFAASFAAGSPTTRYNVPIASGNTMYMRINRTGNQWKQSYSYDGNNWIAAANFSYAMVVSSAGPFAGNAPGSSSPAFTGLIDYFFDTSSPIVPEDGGNYNDLIISLQPVNQEVEVGGTASFSVVATGTAPLSYQWQKNDTNIIGATNATYTILSTNLSDNGSTYRVNITNPSGSVMSNSARLTIISPTAPTIITQPSNQTVTAGQNATFSVVATGSSPLSYQWQKNGTNIPGATSASYTTPATTMSDNGSTFSVNVTNPLGSVMSDQATLTLRTPLTIISDDFNSLTLNSSLWTIIDPKNDSKFTLIGNGTHSALLSITIPAGISHDAWAGGNYAPRIMQSVNNTNFEIEVKFQSRMTSQYQIQGLIIQQDSNNYLRFDFVRNSATINIFAASFTEGSPTVKYDVGITTRTPLYLRINRTGDQWKQFYSYNGIKWISAANFTHKLKVTSLGPYVGNHGIPQTSSPAFTGLIDYFFNTSSPVIPEDVPDTTSPITLWYGNPQRFGQIGVPQQWVNILGNADNEYGIATMNYSLNNGSVSNLSIGPESYRLESIGDFNVELDRKDLLCGDNRVAINATDNAGNTKREIVSINYSCNNVWPGNYNITWSNVSNIQDVAQVVDGLWTRESNSIRPTIIGYDRLISIGDMTRDDYEITVPVTLNAALDSNAPHSGPNFGVGMRWQGHYDSSSSQQPREGWYPIGALGVYIWAPEVNDFRLRIIGNGMYVIANDNSGRHLNVGVPYMFKMRAQTIGANTLYSLKVWEQNTNEPAAWTISGYGGYGELKQGSALLNSHYANVSYGNVTIRPGPFENALAISGVSVDVYANSATVSWITSKQASSKVSYGLSTAYGNGSVVDGTMVLSHAIFLEGLKPGTNYHYKVKSTDLMGYSSSTEDMNFTTMPVVNITSIASDDFNAPTLNTSLWTIVNPKGDATITIIGNGTGDALLSIAVPGGQEHDVWQGNNAPRVMQYISNTNFEIELKFQSQPTSAYQIQGIIIQQDSNNYLRFDFVKSPTSTNIFAASFAAGSPTTRYNFPITSGNPLYLKVNRTGNLWKQFYSSDGTNWIAAANFNYPLIVSSAGPFAGNAFGSSSPAFTGLVDYFFNTSSPVVPEDGGK